MAPTPSPTPKPSPESASPEDVTAAALHAQLDHARTTLERLAAEYDGLLGDPDAIQEDRDTTRQLMEEARANVAAAEDAVRRFDEGTYGHCSKCGRAIAPERLEAIPDADTCVACA